MALHASLPALILGGASGPAWNPQSTPPNSSLGIHDVVHLIPGNAYITKSVFDPQVIGVRCIGIQCGLGFEFAAKHHVTGIFRMAVVNPDLKPDQSWNFSIKGLKLALQLFGVSYAFCPGSPLQVPHDDVLYHL